MTSVSSLSPSEENKLIGPICPAVPLSWDPADRGDVTIWLVA